MTIWIILGALACVVVLFVAWANLRIVRIGAPTLAFLNLLGDSANKLLHEDRDALRASFYDVVEVMDLPVKCDVLMIYATVERDGSLAGTSKTLRELILDSGARIVIVANDNPSEYYTAALQPTGGKANLILTLERRGWRFAHFMKQLFETMEKGISMPVAWVRLAPQKPGDPHEDCPATLFLCELGQITFKRN